MKKNLLLFGATAIMMSCSVTFTSCKQEEPKQKNYYGVQPEEQAPKDAYTAFFCVSIGLVILAAIGIKRLKKK